MPLSAHLRSEREPRGEYTIVVEPKPVDAGGRTPYNDEGLRVEFAELVSQGAVPRSAIRSLAQKYGLGARQVYSVVHQTNGS